MKRLKILLVEDNPGDAELIQEAFVEQSRIHADVAVAVDGEEALDYLLRQGRHTNATQPDLIVLDLNLPKIHGREVLATIKKHERLRRVPIVVLTTSDAERDISQCYELGANCYVTKPVELKAFQTSVRSIENFWLTVAKLP